MKQTETWTPEGAIARLADAGWDCPQCQGRGKLLGAPSPLPGSCEPCGGTGRIVPFEALRVKCENCRLSSQGPGKISDGQRCPICKGVSWLPERNVKVACWEIEVAHPEILSRTSSAHHEPGSLPGEFPTYRRVGEDGRIIWGMSRIEATLRAGEAYVEERERANN